MTRARALSALELHERDRLGHALAHLGPRPPCLPERERDVLEDVQVREEGVALEDGVHGPPVRAHAVHVLPGHPDQPRRRLLEAGDHAQRRRLAAAGRADQREELALLDVERELAHGDEVAEALGHRIEADGGGAHAR
ncbi:MAG TPA: hypothetical protein VGL44_14775 [Gaiellales bacterium]